MAQIREDLEGDIQVTLANRVQLMTHLGEPLAVQLMQKERFFALLRMTL
jgi:hypothetical protein